MPATEEEFEALFQYLLRNNIFSTTEFAKERDKRFPDLADRHAYYEWSFKTSAQMWSLQATAPTDDELIKNIGSTNFNDKTQRASLCRLIQRDSRPMLFMGQDAKGVGYRIIPEVYGLQAHHEYTAGTVALPRSVLGVNTDSHPEFPKRPRNHRKEAKSDESMKSAETDETDNNGFAFHQIGILECYEPEDANRSFTDEAKSKEEAAELEGWEPTGFNAVVRIDSNGNPQGVYAIFNMFPEDDSSGKRYQVETAQKWGYLPRHELRFSMAKMAESVHDMKRGAKITWSEVVTDTVEIVRACQHECPARILRCVRPDESSCAVEYIVATKLSTSHL